MQTVSLVSCSINKNLVDCTQQAHSVLNLSAMFICFVMVMTEKANFATWKLRTDYNKLGREGKAKGGPYAYVAAHWYLNDAAGNKDDGLLHVVQKEQ